MPPVKRRTKHRRRKRKSHYITGIHNSPKCSTPIEYRSGWELTVAHYLDSNPDVVSYEYESFRIPYVVAGKPHIYTPDFFIQYKSGKKIIVEVKRADKLTNRVVIAKATATRKWLRENNMDVGYEFWSNSLIAGFKKLLEIKKIS